MPAVEKVRLVFFTGRVTPGAVTLSNPPAVPIGANTVLSQVILFGTTISRNASFGVWADKTAHFGIVGSNIQQTYNSTGAGDSTYDKFLFLAVLADTVAA